MKVLLIYPKFPDTFWSFSYALPFIGKKAAFPPLGLLTVAAMLPEQFQKRLVDVNVDRLTDDDLSWADMAFIGGMAVQRDSAKKIIARCKQSGLKVIAGGPLFTAEPDEFGEVDHLVLGEAELTLPPFLEDLKNGRPQKIYRASDFCDLHQTPFPLWDLIPIKKYASMSIQFSRGCPFNCEFCNVTALFGRRSRLKTPQQIISELDRIYASGWRGSIFFVDDNFIGNKLYLKTHLLPALIEWRKDKKGCVFFTEASINLADDPELLDMMVTAGFDSVFIGIESPDEVSLTECHKTQNKNRDLLESVAIIHRSGLQVMGGFIVGFDSDMPSIFQRQIDFIQKSGIVTAMVGLLQAPPGTRLFDRLQRESRVVNIFSGDNVNATTNIIPRMGLDRLLDGYRSIMKQIYSPKNYYRRVRTLLKELKAPEIYQPINIQRFLSIFRSAFRLGVLGKERFHYWRLLLWTLLRKPRLVPLAVTLAIYGHHYRRICELYIL
ncbi:MAG: B12-binding domain-containing radical SAM protein [Deltaproteobacteria bacterium]|nr:B12-binding domain-containing radical SAM protein [Desulfobacteraceae bacterium]MDH3838761.1 B12-binding domain-containing radical SAM protein [Desulfobacteraceae bacterium]MDH3876033.1 B12-binding domain-containing radical SAM protein [Desulfobacteraceae bacterium]MDH3929015.1 B12-binding domain-containing radical SAM protein [Deltaproteobacteria bacterium]